jgi:hypothetical protein
MATMTNSSAWLAENSEPPLYQCHKMVRALRIRDMKNDVWQPDDNRYGLQEFTAEFLQKHHPHSGGYVLFANGDYFGFMSAHEFELDHTLVA